VAISGDSVIIGAFGDDAGGDSSGSAYVFTRTGGTWTQQQKLTANDAAEDDEFGTSVAISDDSVVISAIGDGGNSGSAYVFTRSAGTWTQQGKLTANDAATNDQFGIFVAISGDSVVIGARDNDDDGDDSGSAYIFRLAVSEERTLLVFDHAGQTLGDGDSAQAFLGQELGSSVSYTFRLVNGGELDLDLQSVTLDGNDADQFSLDVPDISSNPDLASGEELDFTVTITPSGVNSGSRNASIVIASNDTNILTLSVNISGLGLSRITDTDGDGLNDLAEFSLRSAGFDWEETQINRVSDFYTAASQAGLFQTSEIADISVGMTLTEVNSLTNTAELIFELEESTDLTTFSPLIVDPADLSVNGDGNILYEADAPAGTLLFRTRVR